MNRNKLLKGLALASVFFWFLPALIYYAIYWKTLSDNSNVIKLKEIGALLAITGLATLSHAGVSFVQQSTGLGTGFLIVSVFIFFTKIAALTLFYIACKSDENTHNNMQTSGY